MTCFNFKSIIHAYSFRRERTHAEICTGYIVTYSTRSRGVNAFWFTVYSGEVRGINWAQTRGVSGPIGLRGWRVVNCAVRVRASIGLDWIGTGRSINVREVCLERWMWDCARSVLVFRKTAIPIFIRMTSCFEMHYFFSRYIYFCRK